MTRAALFPRSHLRVGRRLHRLLKEQGLYPVVAASALCVGLFAFRAYLSRRWTYYFLLWNLFLAWIPYLASLWVVALHRRHPRRWWLLLLPGALSVAFFPNAPYIITDFFHLAERPPVPLWYDLGLLATFAWTGVVLGVYALRLLQNVVARLAGRVVGWLFALSVLGLSGVGIYLGRFLRWNSWDLLLRPKAVLYDVAVRVRHHLGHPQTVGVTLLFGALLTACYLALILAPTSEGNRE
jgi:uncharacterized membrane protein